MMKQRSMEEIGADMVSQVFIGIPSRDESGMFAFMQFIDGVQFGRQYEPAELAECVAVLRDLADALEAKQRRSVN